MQANKQTLRRREDTDGNACGGKSPSTVKHIALTPALSCKSKDEPIYNSLMYAMRMAIAF